MEPSILSLDTPFWSAFGRELPVGCRSTVRPPSSSTGMPGSPTSANGRGRGGRLEVTLPQGRRLSRVGLEPGLGLGRQRGAQERAAELPQGRHEPLWLCGPASPEPARGHWHQPGLWLLTPPTERVRHEPLLPGRGGSHQHHATDHLVGPHERVRAGPHQHHTLRRRSGERSNGLGRHSPALHGAAAAHL